jgi:hypothetical protein
MGIGPLGAGETKGVNFIWRRKFAIMAARHLHILGFATALVLAFQPAARAGLSWNDSWSAQSSDGRYILVMRQSDSESANPANKEGADLAAKYKQSGIYRRGDSKDSLCWTVPYQPPVFDAYLSPNGEHLLLTISAGHMSSNVPPLGALHFFHKNLEPQHWLEYEFTWAYLVKELLYIYPLRSWGEWTDTTYDPAANTFTVKTNRAEEFVFDVATGKKIRTSSYWDRFVLVFLPGIPILIFAIHRMASRTSQRNVSGARWRVSMAEALLLITIVAMLLALARFSAVVSAAVLLLGLGGGAVAQLVARGRRAWWLGGILAVYGSVLGLILFSVFVEPMIWKLPRLNENVVLAVMGGLFVMGAVSGAVFGGLLAKKRV